MKDRRKRIFTKNKRGYKMKLRKYRGFYDDGHDAGEFEYYSYHKNYSKQNMEDMKNEYIKKYGYNQYKNKEFNFGYLIKED